MADVVSVTSIAAATDVVRAAACGDVLVLAAFVSLTGHLATICSRYRRTISGAIGAPTELQYPFLSEVPTSPPCKRRWSLHYPYPAASKETDRAAACGGWCSWREETAKAMLSTL